MAIKMAWFNLGDSNKTSKTGGGKQTWSIAGLLYPQVSHLKKIKNYWQFQKTKLEYATLWQLFTEHLNCIYNYLHSVYIELGIINKLGVI